MFHEHFEGFLWIFRSGIFVEVTLFVHGLAIDLPGLK
jgi:hypothetical protein